MDKSLTQRTTFQLTTFRIEDSGLLIKAKSKESESELHFPFEQITTNRLTVLDHNKGVLALACSFAVISLVVFMSPFFDQTAEPIAAPLWLTISLLLFFSYFRTRRKKIFLQATEKRTIEFIAQNNTLENVNRFIELLLNERNLYLLSKYGNVNRNLEYGPQLQNLDWLLNNRAISKTHYDEKVQELNHLFNNHLGYKSIGFSQNN